MNTNNIPHLLLALAALSLADSDPLVDEDNTSPFSWSVGEDITWTPDSDPAWQAESWASATYDRAVGGGMLSTQANLAWLVEDFRFDSGWSLQPRFTTSWTRDRLGLSGSGWGWVDQEEWIDQGLSGTAIWRLTKPGSEGAAWKTSLTGWTSEASGSGFGVGLARSTGGDWSTSQSVALRYLLDVDVANTAQSSKKTIVKAGTTTADQWQLLLHADVSREWETISAGPGLDIDLRAYDASSTRTSMSGKGKGMSSSKTTTTESVDPYGQVSWTPGSWTFSVMSGWTFDFQKTKLSSTTGGLWSQLSAGYDW